MRKVFSTESERSFDRLEADDADVEKGTKHAHSPAPAHSELINGAAKAELYADRGLCGPCTMTGTPCARFVVLFVLASFISRSTAQWWFHSPLVDQMVEALPVPIKRVPFLVAMLVALIGLSTGLGAIFALGAVVPAGYNNSSPRKMKSATELGSRYPAIFRLQSAHFNTLEFLAMMMPCYWAAYELEVPPMLFAKASLLTLISRIVYVIMYICNFDYFRTTAFGISVATIAFVGITALLQPE